MVALAKKVSGETGDLRDDAADLAREAAAQME
jgi:hypothetical protein